MKYILYIETHLACDFTVWNGIKNKSWRRQDTEGQDNSLIEIIEDSYAKQNHHIAAKDHQEDLAVMGTAMHWPIVQCYWNNIIYM